jgi:ribonuclease BN (tRNA processing enzyme)
MNLTILGCGTILQKDTVLNCSGYLLEDHFLFDCGPGIWKSLNQYKIPIDLITHIFFSHYHVDHTSDLGPLLLNRHLISRLQNVPLNVVGPVGLVSWFSNLKKLLGQWSEDIPVNLNEIDNQPYQSGKYIITAMPTGHTENSVCYRVDINEKSFFYSGDTGMSDNVISLSTGCNLAVMEASNTAATHIPEHLTPSLAAKMANAAKVQKLVLTHMYPEVMDGDPARDASEEYSGPIIIAKEGMSIRF